MSRPDPLSRRGYTALVLGVTGIGIAPLFVRSISASALTIATGASVLAAVGAIVLAALVRAPLTLGVLRSALPGGVAFALAQILAFSAFQETSLAIASLITCMTPLLIVVVAVPLFGERLRAPQVAWAAFALVGVVAVILGAPDDGSNTLKGDLLALGSLFAGAGVLLLMKHRRMGGVGASAYTAGMFLTAAVVESVFLVFESDRGRLSGDEWMWLAFLGVVLGGSMGLMTWAQRHTNVAISSVLSLGATVITAVGGWVFFDEALNAVQIAGGVAVLVCLGGIVMGQVGAGEARDVVVAEPAWLPEPPPDERLAPEAE